MTQKHKPDGIVQGLQGNVMLASGDRAGNLTDPSLCGNGVHYQAANWYELQQLSQP